MREPGNNYIKAWAREYEEAPFYFEQKSERGSRLIAWSEEPNQTQRALYAIIENMPWEVEILLKICAPSEDAGKPLWSRFHGSVSRAQLTKAISENEHYVFSDGSHQLCVKDPESHRYMAFDEHGIFFVYAPREEDANLFRNLGFENRYAEPLYGIPHFKHIVPDSEKMEMKFITDLSLRKANSDLDK
jgi:hypothetical protein